MWGIRRKYMTDKAKLLLILLCYIIAFGDCLLAFGKPVEFTYLNLSALVITFPLALWYGGARWEK